MRKISPENIRDDFRKQLDELTTFHNAGFAAFTSEADRSTLTEHSLLAAAVAWEGFVSAMFIAFINRDPSRFKQHLKDSLEQHVNKEPTPKRVYDSFGTLTFPTHMKKADVLALADSIGNNITSPNFDQLQSKARTWLASQHAEKFTGLTTWQKAVVNSVIALRNHIAHRSKRSLDAMNDVLGRDDLIPTGIKRLDNRFHNVGVWLKATPVGGNETRFASIVQILKEIAATF